MSVKRALKAAVLDVYRNSLRIVALNGALSLVVLAIVAAASYVQAALLLLLLVGPLAAALMHCAVTLAQTEELTLGDGLVGLRLHWRRGLELALLVGAFVALGILAVGFYAGRGAHAWPFAALATYLLVLFALWQLVLWPLAIFERTRAFRGVLADAAVALARRPAPTVALALALLAINAVGALGVLPFLTLTIAYSFLAAAHFVLPPADAQEAPG